MELKEKYLIDSVSIVSFFLVWKRRPKRHQLRRPNHQVRAVSIFTEFYRVLPSFTEFYRVLPSFTEFYRVLHSLILAILLVQRDNDDLKKHQLRTTESFDDEIKVD